MVVDLDRLGSDLLEAVQHGVDVDEEIREADISRNHRAVMTMEDGEALLALSIIDPDTFGDLVDTLILEGAFEWPERPLIPEHRIDLGAMLPVDAEAMFRFTGDAIVLIAGCIGLPNVIVTKHRYRVTGVEALAMVLRRFTNAGRLFEMVKEFGRSDTAICRILIETSTYDD